MTYCHNCGSGLHGHEKFCPACGTRVAAAAPDGAHDATRDTSEDDATATVTIAGSNRRCHPGALAAAAAGDMAALEEATSDLTVSVDSPEARAADTPFDPSRIPGPDDWVPANSAWAIHPYPGPVRGPITGKLDRKFAALGTVAGRPLSELIRYVGPPTTSMSMGPQKTLTWSSGVRSSYHVGLVFDQYDVCGGVVSEMSM